MSIEKPTGPKPCYANRPGHNHPLPYLERYWINPETECWEWVGAFTPGGYGTCWIRGRQYAAHRVLYEHHVGPIPEGLQLDHLCRVRGCVNPDHLEPVTHAENSRRRPDTKLTAQAVVEIREVTDALCAKYGIKPGTLAHIAQRTRWVNP